jgi:hypothetical protein
VAITVPAASWHGDAFGSRVVLLAIRPANGVRFDRQQELTWARVRIFTVGEHDLPFADEPRRAGMAWH